MRVAGYQPRNNWLHRQLDRRWRRWLVSCLAGAALVSTVMAGLVAPRQATLRLRYEIARTSAEVERLDGKERGLLLEREALTSPATLAHELPDLGLAPVPPARVAHLTATGDLVVVGGKPTPSPDHAHANRKPDPW
jgi:hypothetical protein